MKEKEENQTKKKVRDEKFKEKEKNLFKN